MRLNEPTNRANTNIVNTLLGEDKIYAGSKSSLDYKVKGDGVLSTSKNGKKKKNQQTDNDQQQQPQQADRRNSHRSGFPTRTRERTGIPPRRYGLSDLATMSEDELMTALREDPEFAAAVQEYSTQLEQKEKEEKAAEAEQKERRSKPSSPPVAERRKARLAKSSSSEPTATPTIRPGLEKYPGHIRELVDSGVPVTQWIVLLLLVGAGLYYLMGPELKEGLAYIMKQTGKTKKRSQKKGHNNKSKFKSRQGHKGKKKVEPPRKSSTVKQTPIISESPPETSQRESPNNSSTRQEIPKETLPEPSSMAEKTKKKKNKKKRKKETKTEAKESVDLASTDDASTLHSDAEETPVVSPPPDLSTPVIQMEPDSTDDGEWETVTRSRKPVAKPPPATPVASKEDPEAKNETVEEMVATTTSEVATVEKTSPSIDIQQEIEAAEKFTAQEESANDGWATVTKSRKPKASTPAASESKIVPTTHTESSNSTKQKAKAEDKKKQVDNVTADKKTKKSASKNKKEHAVKNTKSDKAGEDVTDGDAALALKLQMEEEKLAKGPGQAEEQWEEVKKNKNKKGQKA